MFEAGAARNRPSRTRERRARFTAGAAPVSLPCAAITLAMPVPCGCGLSAAPVASNDAATTPARSGCVASIGVSMTATRTLSPFASACASGSRSLASEYCAGSAAAEAGALLHGDKDSSAARRECALPPAASGSPCATGRPSLMRSRAMRRRVSVKSCVSRRVRRWRRAMASSAGAGRRGRDIQQHLVRHEAPLAGGRHVEAAALRELLLWLLLLLRSPLSSARRGGAASSSSSTTTTVPGPPGP